MRIVAVINPATRRAAAAKAALLRQATALALPEPQFLETTVDAPGAAQARTAVAQGADVVVAIGGDGTVRNVASTLAGTSMPLGVIPSGTANLFALNTGIPRSRRRLAARIALSGATQLVDMGHVRVLRSPDRPATEHEFLVVAGLGNDAATLTDVTPASRYILGWLAYVVAGIRRLAAPMVALTVDGRPEKTWCVLVGNTGRLPLGIRLFPDARPDDGLLTTMILPLASPLEWVRVAASGILGRTFPPLRYEQASEVTVGADAPTPAHVDGDPIGEVTSLEVSIRPGVLQLRVPTDNRRLRRRNRQM